MTRFREQLKQVVPVDSTCHGKLKPSFKVETIHGERFINRTEAKQHIFDYIEVYYNRKQLHSKLR